MNTAHSTNELVRASVLVGFESYIRERGHDPLHLLSLAGLPEVYLREPDMYLPYRAFIHLLDLCAGKMSNPLLGAEFGFEQGHKAFGPTAYLISSSDNLKQALESMFRYYRLHTTACRLELRQTDRKVMFHFEIAIPTTCNVTQVLDNACAVGMRMMQTFCGSAWKADELHLQHDAPSQLKHRYSRLFGLEPQFNSDWTGFVFNTSFLNVALPEADHALHKLIEQKLSVMMDDHTQNLPRRVAAVIREAMPAGDISLKAIARLMAMSPRSLQRHLNTQGTSFQSIVSESRRQLAEHYLLHTSIQLTCIADLLCFNCLSHFSHVFKQWHGVSPGQWKKLHR